MCNCRNYIIDEWSCKLTHGQNYVKKVLALQNISKNNSNTDKYQIHNQTKDIHNSDYRFMKWYQDKMKTNYK